MTITLLEGDCRKVLRGIDAASVDLVLTDPPYGETALDWDVRCDGWLTECARVMKPSASLWMFGSLKFFVGRAGDFAGWKIAQDVIWEKHNGSDNRRDRFRRVHEHVVQFYRSDWNAVFKAPQFTNDARARVVRRSKKPAHWNSIQPSEFRSVEHGPRLMRSVIYEPSCHGRALHPTQKPLGILESLIRYSCPPGGTVLDCFAGSGSTGIAARLAGRDALLIEQNAKFAGRAHRRRGGASAVDREFGRMWNHGRIGDGFGPSGVVVRCVARH